MEPVACVSSHQPISVSKISNGNAPSLKSLSWNRRTSNPHPPKTIIVAETAILMRAVCVTDDPHIMKIREVRTRWI